MKITEKEIFEMEKTLINKYFRGIQPREIEIVKDNSFAGLADEKLKISQFFFGYMYRSGTDKLA